MKIEPIPLDVGNTISSPGYTDERRYRIYLMYVPMEMLQAGITAGVFKLNGGQHKTPVVSPHDAPVTLEVLKGNQWVTATLPPDTEDRAERLEPVEKVEELGDRDQRAGD